MSTATRQSTFSSSAAAGSLPERSYFEAQRDALLSELGVSLEHVLQNINKLNRSLEGVIAVGNEFSSVEALWSQFESVMDKEPEAEKEGGSSVGGEVDEEEDTTMTQMAGAQS